MLRWLQTLARACERWRAQLATERRRREVSCNRWLQALPLPEIGCVAPQVQGQLKMVPERLRGYYYSVGSLALGALLGVIVYGPMVWTS